MKSDERRVMDVCGLRVLVTAGASGIGRAIAGAFAEAGSLVHITDIDEAAIQRALSEDTRLSASVGDASNAADVDRAITDVGGKWDGLDVLISNVGIAGPTGPVAAYADEDVDRTIDVNLKSHFYFAKRCVPLLKASPTPSILALSSVAGRLGYPYRAPYAATKWAIVGMVKSLAPELGPDGIRVNAILPGVVSGPRMEDVIAERAIILGIGIEQMRQAYLERISLRRMVDAEDVANLALFLSSPLARNISGQAISVDGNVEYL